MILNPASGPGHVQDEVEDLRRAFAEAGARVEVHVATDHDPVDAIAERVLRDGPPLVVAAGGDGTVSAVAARAAGTRTALAVLPFGTHNHFALDLGIPLAPAQAIQVALQAGRASVDVGEVNGRVFVNNSSIGVYADVVRHRRRQQRHLGRSKRMAMLWAIRAAVSRAQLLTMRLELDGEAREIRSPFVFVGNNDYVMQGFRIDRRASLEGGTLSVYTTQRNTAAGLYLLAIRAILHRLQQAEDFSASLVRSLTVELPRKRVLVTIDGEVTSMETPLEYHVRPRALIVVVPEARPS